jgi:hypothetical protein
VVRYRGGEGSGGLAVDNWNLDQTTAVGWLGGVCARAEAGMGPTGERGQWTGCRGMHAKQRHALRFGAPGAGRVAVLQAAVRAAIEWLSLQQLSSPPWPVPSPRQATCSVCPPLPSLGDALSFAPVRCHGCRAIALAM